MRVRSRLGVYVCVSLGYVYGVFGFVGFVSYVSNGRCSVTAPWMSVVT